MTALKYKELYLGTSECSLDLDQLYDKQSIKPFNQRWEEFVNSDPYNAKVLNRNGNIITYPHKSWVPSKNNNVMSVLMLFGNPAPHSTYHDVYFSFEGKGTEHRFWKVLRELGYINLKGTDPKIKEKFFELDYESPFRLGFDVVFSFPSSASQPKWSGVTGIQKLFGKKAFEIIVKEERERMRQIISDFFKEDKGVIIAFQKDAFNMLSTNEYSLAKAVEGSLKESYRDKITLFGTPPTRWLYTQKMKNILSEIKMEAQK